MQSVHQNGVRIEQFTRAYPYCKLDGVFHKSDCAAHNMPAYPNGDCNCNPFVLSGDVPVDISEGDYIITSPCGKRSVTKKSTIDNLVESFKDAPPGKLIVLPPTVPIEAISVIRHKLATEQNDRQPSRVQSRESFLECRQIDIVDALHQNVMHMANYHIPLRLPIDWIDELLKNAKELQEIKANKPTEGPQKGV